MTKETKPVKPLYGVGDILGLMLSRWRIGAVRPFINDGRLIDLACGDNRLCRSLGRGIGVDIHDYGNVDLVLTDFSRLPFADKSIDTVTILAALNYFDDPAGLIGELHRVLRDDGNFLVTFLLKPVSALWHKFRDRSLPRIAYSQQELAELLHGSGFVIEQRVSFMFGLNRLYIIRKVSGGTGMED